MKAALVAAALITPSMIMAQATTPVVTPVAASVASISAPVTENILRAGAPVALKMSEPLQTDHKGLKVGYRFQMEVAEPVMVGSNIVIPAGTPVTGEVTGVKNTGMWGKAGGIEARVLFARLNGRQIRMTGAFDDKGKSGTVGVVAAVALLPVAGFFVKGKNANIALGAPVSAFMDEDLAFTPAVAVAPVAASPLMPAVDPASAAPSAPILTPVSATKR